MPNRTESLHTRESDALAAMMGADSRRIDDLVGAVGEVRGDVSHLRGDVTRVVQGVDDLKEAMVGVARHSVLLETQQRDNEAMRQTQRDTNARLLIVETRLADIDKVMPGLIETRAWAVRAGLTALGVVGLALLALVMRKP